MAVCSSCYFDPCICNGWPPWSPPEPERNLTNVTFSNLKALLISKFPPPYPREVSVVHHKCGGAVEETNLWYSDIRCRKCDKEWTSKEVDENPKDFTGRDEAVYTIETQNKPVDEWGNKQTRAYDYLKAK